jgi:hypothetical protein
MSGCLHEDFDARVEVTRIANDPTRPPDAYMADIEIKCAVCGERFYWPGLAAGMNYNRPMVSVNGFQLRAPIRPDSTDRELTIHAPGFSVEVYGEPT